MRADHPLRATGRAALRFMPNALAERLRSMRRAMVNRRGATEIFSEIFANNDWGDGESVSGPGSNAVNTAAISAALPDLLQELRIRSLLDLPCGDADWIARILPDEIDYLGGDIVPAIVERNRIAHRELRRFEVMDIVRSPLPQADLLLCRDCFIHLPNAMVRQALDNIRRSGVRWLLTTHYPNVSSNIEIELGGFRPIDLTIAPFDLPAPDRIIMEEAAKKKSCGLWRVDRLR